MSFREFEEPNHASLYSKYRQTPPISLIERIIKFLREKYSGPLNQAVDLGCGSGQCTFLLTDRFDQVLGSDISSAQINEALEQKKEKKCDNVTFCVSPAEKIPLGDQSVQLITSSVAAHWFDLPKVYQEGRRVLCPGGVMAFFCYDFPTVKLGNDSKRNQELADINEYVYQTFQPYFAPPAKLAFHGYKDITIPYADLTREHDFLVEMTVNFGMILGTFRSFSGFQAMCKIKGDEEGEQFLEKVKTRYLEILEISSLPQTEEALNKNVFTFIHNYSLVMARI